MPLPTLPKIPKNTPADVALKMLFTPQSGLRAHWNKAKTEIGKNLDTKAFKADLGPSLDTMMKKVNAAHAEYRRVNGKGDMQPAGIAAKFVDPAVKSWLDAKKIIVSYRAIAVAGSKSAQQTPKQRQAWTDLNVWLEQFEDAIATTMRVAEIKWRQDRATY